METLIANLTGKVRQDTLAGRECLVVPLSMIAPGILNGSRGPLLYESPELKKSADAWNGMPIVLRHPVVNGAPVSARSPKILNQFSLGTVLTSRFDGKLKAEGWFDVQNTERIAPDVLALLRAGKPVELSTGLFADYVPATEGATFNGQSYDFKVTNMRPDHLAVLPDEVGACSLRDGCGVLINQESVENEWSDAARQAAAASRKKKSQSRKSANTGTAARAGKGRIIGSGMKAKQEAAARRQKILDKRAQSKGYKDHADRQAKIQAYKKSRVAAYRSRRLAAGINNSDSEGSYMPPILNKSPTLNELSHMQTQCELQEALGERFSQGDAYACVTDVYDDFFIYQQGGDLYKLAYTKSDAGVSITGDPIEVERVVTFVPEPEESGESSSSGEMEMARNAAEKKAVVDSLIANSCGCWTEADREVLNQFKDERLDQLVANVAKNKQQEQINNAVKTAVEAGIIVLNEGKIEPKKAEPVVNHGPVNLGEYLKTAPPEVARIIQNSLATEQREKDELIEKITANKANTFAKEALQAMGLETLRPLATLAAPAAPAFYGQGGGPIANRKTEADNDGPIPPTINWAEFAKQPA